MTAKRFDWDVCDGDALFYENGAVIDYDDVVELLNELYEENQELKKENAELEKFRYFIFKRMGELYEE